MLKMEKSQLKIRLKRCIRILATWISVRKSNFVALFGVFLVFFSSLDVLAADNVAPIDLSSVGNLTYGYYSYNIQSGSEFVHYDGGIYNVGQKVTVPTAYWTTIRFDDVNNVIDTSGGILDISFWCEMGYFDRVVVTLDYSGGYRDAILASTQNGYFTYDIPKGRDLIGFYIDFIATQNTNISFSVFDISFYKKTSLSDVLGAVNDMRDIQQGVVNDASSAFQDTESKVATSLSDYQEQESILVSDSVGRLESFDFSTGSIETMGSGVLAAAWWIQQNLTNIFLLTEYSSVLHVVAIVSLAAILIGARRLWRS